MINRIVVSALASFALVLPASAGCSSNKCTNFKISSLNAAEWAVATIIKLDNLDGTPMDTSPITVCNPASIFIRESRPNAQMISAVLLSGFLQGRTFREVRLRSDLGTTANCEISFVVMDAE